MSKSLGKSPGSLVIGGPARADLLPPEVGAAARGKVVRRNAIAIIILAIILVVVGYAGATFVALGAQLQLDAANQRTQVLLEKQKEFSEVRSVKSMLETGTAARIAATSTEIDWKTYFEKIQAILPAGTIVTNVSANAATPLSAFAQPSVPLQGDRIGELTFTATSASLPDVERWLQSLATLPGFVDAAPGNVSLQGDSTYQVSITMHINKDVLLLRFDDKLKEARDAALAKAKAEKEAKDAKDGVTATPTPSPPPSPSAEPSPEESVEPAPESSEGAEGAGAVTGGE